MARHVVVGAGAIGRATASALVRGGHEVVLASRSGTGPDLAGARRTRVDATDPAALIEVATGAAGLINAVNPNYTSWSRDWPPMARAFLAAAQASGAGLVTIGNLYGYGPSDGPVHVGLPLAATGSKGRVRAQMWLDAKAAHDAGRIRATELRASDYFGPGASPDMSLLMRFVLAPAAAGKVLHVLDGSPEALHSWTYVPDIGDLAARLATSDIGWGRPWHVPSGMPRSVAQVAADVAAYAGRPAPSIKVMPRWVRTALGAAIPVVRAIAETAYQRERAFVIDASETESTFGLTATPWEQSLDATLSSMGVKRADVSARR